MGNAFLTPTEIAKLTLMALENETVLSGLVYRGYSSEFVSGRGATVLIRVPPTMSATTVSNTVNVQDVSQSSVPFVLDKLADVSATVTTKDLTLSVYDFTELFIRPMARAHAQLLDLYGAHEAANWANYATVAGTPAVADIVQLGAVMDTMKVPSSERRLVFNPMTKAGYMVLEPFLYAEHRADGGRALREAELGRTLGFDVYTDQNVGVKHTAGDMADLAGAIKGAGTVGDGTATVDAITASGTVLAGDVFKITGYDGWYRVSANATASTASEIVITFSPTFKEVIADDSVVTFQGSGRDNMAFHKMGLGLATAPLEPPLGGARAEVVTYKGLSTRVVYGYNQMTKVNIISMDMLYGWKTLNKDLCARLIDQRTL